MWANNVPFRKCSTKRKWIRQNKRVWGLCKAILTCVWMHCFDKTNSFGIWYTFALLWEWKNSLFWPNYDNSRLKKTHENQWQFCLYLHLHHLSPHIISSGVGRKISRCYKFLLCSYRQYNVTQKLPATAAYCWCNMPPEKPAFDRCTLDHTFSSCLASNFSDNSSLYNINRNID